MIFVTGSTGFVGRGVVRHLMASGAPARCLLRPPEGDLRPVAVDMELCWGDVTDLDSLRRAMVGCETVVHLASITRDVRGHSLESVNVGGTENVVTAARESGVRRLIYLSTCIAHADSPSAHARSRAGAEEIVRNSGIPHLILRPTLMFGYGDGFLELIAPVVRTSPVVPIPSRSNRLIQPVSVEDVSLTVVKAALATQIESGTIVVSGNEQYTVTDFFELIGGLLGQKGLYLPLPEGLFRMLTRAAERLGVSLSLAWEVLLSAPQGDYDLEPLKAVLGRNPTPIPDELAFYLKRFNPEIILNW